MARRRQDGVLLHWLLCELDSLHDLVLNLGNDLVLLALFLFFLFFLFPEEDAEVEPGGTRLSSSLAFQKQVLPVRSSTSSTRSAICASSDSPGDFLSSSSSSSTLFTSSFCASTACPRNASGVQGVATAQDQSGEDRSSHVTDRDCSPPWRVVLLALHSLLWLLLLLFYGCSVRL